MVAEGAEEYLDGKRMIFFVSKFDVGKIDIYDLSLII